MARSLFLFCFSAVLFQCVTRQEKSPDIADYVPSSSLLGQLDSLQIEFGETPELAEKITGLSDRSWLHGRMKESNWLANRALHINPLDLGGRVLKARSLATMGGLKESQHIYSRILEEDSTRAFAYSELIMAHFFDNQPDKAYKLVNQFLNHRNKEVDREIQSVAAVLSFYDQNYFRAVTHLKQRLALTTSDWDVEESVLNHPYWDMHLIGNLYLTIGKLDSAIWWYEKGTQFADSTLTGRPLRITRDNTEYFMSELMIHLDNPDSAYYFVQKGFDKNQNGLGSKWAQIMIEKNDPDSALSILRNYCRGGYYRMFLEAKALHLKGEKLKARQKLDSILQMNHIGILWWQHEYALLKYNLWKFEADNGL